MISPANILVVVTRRIGDVLLTTPLIRSLRLAWPRAKIDVLVFAGTEGVLFGNHDINRILTVAPRLALGEHLRFLAGLWWKYDLSLSAVPSDRPTIYAFMAGKQRIGLVAEGKKHQWKKWLLSQWAPFNGNDIHTVLTHLRLATLLGVSSSNEVVVSWRQEDEGQVRQVLPFDLSAQPYAVLHVYPMFAYKMWRADAWAELSHWLRSQGLRVVLTGGAKTEEADYIQHLMPSLPVDTVNIAGKVSLGGVAYLLSKARGYVGPDTSVTHMAAALGIPVVALFGPSNPVKWGPWPKEYKGANNPYCMKGTQRVNNVLLLQGKGDCVPCMEEGCEHHTASLSDCLQYLPAASAIEAMQELWKSDNAK